MTSSKKIGFGVGIGVICSIAGYFAGQSGIAVAQAEGSKSFVSETVLTFDAGPERRTVIRMVDPDTKATCYYYPGGPLLSCVK